MPILKSINASRALLFAAGISSIGTFLIGCATVATETGYVFATDDAINNPTPKDHLCADVHDYKGDEPKYFAKYAPEKDFTARLQLLSPREKHNIAVGPGVLLPLPLLPDPWGESSALYYHNVPEKEFKNFMVAIYPKPFKPGYFFSPARIRLDIAGKSLYPTRITHHYTVNLAAKQQDLDITREHLAAHSGEFDAYVVEFNIDGIASPSATLHMSGIDRYGAALSVRDYPLSINQSRVFDWEYDSDCQK